MNRASTKPIVQELLEIETRCVLDTALWLTKPRSAVNGGSARSMYNSITCGTDALCGVYGKMFQLFCIAMACEMLCWYCNENGNLSCFMRFWM